MPRRSVAFLVALPARDDTRASFVWLANALRNEILNSRFGAGTRLPSARDIALQCGFSRGTVVRAFEELKAEGYVELSPVAAPTSTEPCPKICFGYRGRQIPNSASTRLNRRKSASAPITPFPKLDPLPARVFRANLPALNLFLVATSVQITGRRFRNASMNLLLGCGPAGYQPLRHAVATYFGASQANVT
jgi:GntR family transcriptional regulator/MocR family aminotransferase